jgi:CBS domain-containing protein
MTVPSPTILESVVADLAPHAPFDAMTRDELGVFAGGLTLRYFARRSEIGPALPGTVAQQLFIIQRGHVSGVSTDNGGSAALTLMEGEMFPLGAMISRRASTLRYIAATDVFCYTMDYATFEAAMDHFRAFRHFATTRLAHLLDQSRASVQREFSARLSNEQTLATHLGDIVRRAPVTVGPATPIRDVLALMHAERIGSVVVVAAGTAQPLGIFTERDVLARVALPAADQSQPVSMVMTPEPFALGVEQPVFEAARAMAERRFRHVIVTRDGKLAGVVSERDLFQLQRLSLGEVAKAVDRASSVPALVSAAADVRRLVRVLMGHGVAAEALTAFVTTMNDAVVARATHIASEVAPPPAGVTWCWLGLGSEGRMEQTLATDQDNALIFDVPKTAALSDAAAPEAASLRVQFLPFAHAVNDILDQCGFPRCKGDIMASNPRWCLSQCEWEMQFSDWMASGSPKALLNASIFFDFRALAGEAQLAASLREWLTSAIAASPVFLRAMAANALEVRPPLGVLRDFVLDDDEWPGTMDLKRMAARPFIDAGRVFALAHRIAATNTAHRLRQALGAMRVSEEEVAAYVDAFHYIQLQRLRSVDANSDERQGGHTSSQPLPANRIDIDRLNELDRRILKEALRQARKLQSRLSMDFQVDHGVR